MSSTEPGVQIVGDGTAEGTKLLIDGHPVRGIAELEWKFNTRERTVTVVFKVTDVKIDMSAVVDPKVQYLLEELADQL